MGWTKRSYNAIFDWIDSSKKASVKAVLLADGLNDVVTRLESATSMGDWYRITQEAVAAVGPRVVESSANAAEMELNKMASALGRKGGQAKSERKTAAVRENGKKGGRPKKKHE